MKNLIKAILLNCLLLLIGCGQKWSEIENNGFNLVNNKEGQTLGYAPASGVKILTVDRYAFKDLNGNGQLDPYEDWRLTFDERAADLAAKMSIEQIAGLMLYSAHQQIPGGGRRSTYNGKSFEESGVKPSDLTDQQIEFLTNDNLRHVLITSVNSPEIAAIWNNNAQALVEGLELGIPANNSSDPRHEPDSDEEYTLGAGGEISRWPGGIGLAATFDPVLVQRFGEIASIEYRALGISTALSPQVDLATDPRWYRFKGTFGSSPELATEMARAYIDGFQSSTGEKEIKEGWGFESVNAMAKHWPGGGSGEGGRDAHYGFGKYAVFPGNMLQTHMKPFIEGAFALRGGTKMATAIMPYYTISVNQDPGGENVGNAFSNYMITDQLREKYGFDGVVCTDWGVTGSEGPMESFAGRPWGLEHLTEAELHYRVLMAGCDQFGGNNDAEPVVEAYKMGVEEFGEEFMRNRFKQSAVRLLKNIFRVGLFENPYLDVSHTRSVVGKPEFMEAGYEAQLKSMVLLKNKGNVLPLKERKTIYIPQRYYPEARNFFGVTAPAQWKDPINPELAAGYYNVTDNPEKADVALVVINSPENGRIAGYSLEDAQKGGNGFMPISLQYSTYTAVEARETSIGGDPRDTDVLNRSYRNKTVDVMNKADLNLVLETKQLMGGKPVIVILKMENPTVVAEFESQIDALIVNFEVQDQAILDVISGKYEPTGLLPLQIPENMATVEKQYEDQPLDMKVHIDSEGHPYDFAFGLNWNGLIQDERSEKYRK
jgi:beta-glucosidase